MNRLSQHWISYHDQFVRDKIILTYPKNLIFTMQLLIEHLNYTVEHIYSQFPHAEKFNVTSLNNVSWEKDIIVFDNDNNLLIAPEPVKQLVNLDKRLKYQEARDEIFGPFRFIPFIEVYKFRYVVIMFLIVCLLVSRHWLCRLFVQENT